MVGELGQPDHQGERRVDAKGNGGLNFIQAKQEEAQDYGGDQPKKKACKYCTWIRSTRQTKPTQLGGNALADLEYNCDHMACFDLGQFSPLEGKYARRRVRNFGSLDMNATGNCKHYNGKSLHSGLVRL